MPDFISDDDIIFAPSFIVAESVGRLHEGKAIGSLMVHDLNVLNNLHLELPGQPNPSRKAGTALGAIVRNEARTTAKTEAVQLIKRFYKGTVGEKELAHGMLKTMRAAWRKVFIAGLRSAGLPGGAVIGETTPLPPASERWYRSATAHETRFLNRFIKAIQDDKLVMPWERRLDMYLDALESFYTGARIQGMPPNTLIHWVGPHDHKSCASCKYMFEQSPFSKYTIPTVPRAGQTICLTNCRDRLLVRRVDPSKLDEAHYSQTARVKHLRAIEVLKRSNGG